MKAKSKPLAQKTPADYGVDTAPRLTTLGVREPSKREAGIKVASVDELIDRLRTAGSGRMKTLVLVEHEGGQLKDATLSAVTAASKLGEVHLLVAGEGVGAVAEAAAKIAGVGKVHVADGAAYRAPAGGECRAGRGRADARPSRLFRRRLDDHRQERRPAGRRHARRHADFRRHRRRGRGHVPAARSTPATPSPP